MIQCSLCYFCCNSSDDLANHIVRTHQNDPNFIVYCSIGGCKYSTKSWPAYRVHCTRYHKDGENVNLEGAIDEERADDLVENVQEYDIGHMLAHHVLRLESQNGLTQVAINAVVNNSDAFLQTAVDSLEKMVAKELGESNVNVDLKSFDNFRESLSQIDLKSKFQRHKMYRSVFGLIQPKPVNLSSYLTCSKKRKRFERKSHKGYIVPFLESLQALLKKTEIAKYIEMPHFSSSDMMFDLGDGEYVRNNQLLADDPHALQIILNCDDIEIVNPIGAHTKKHKLSMFYWTLGNIPPEFRSRIASMQVLAVARTKHLKSNAAINSLLNDFISSLKKLESGIEMQVGSRLRTVKGQLVMVPCDTLASHWLGGFKEGVGFAKRACRTCMADKFQMKNIFESDQVEMLRRDENVHRQNCAALAEFTNADHQKYWSKEWGINKSSPFLQLENFPLCSALVHDPMHLLLEGTLGYELALMLNDFIFVSKYFSLDHLNDKIESFSYSYLESNSKPCPLSKNDITNPKKLKQTASAMFTLSIILPFLISDKVPTENRKWTNFLRLVDIMLLCTSPVADINTAGVLSCLLSSHHREFKLLYPRASIIPKMHYLLHMPEQIIRYGPGRTQWCMRWEAKHSLFKRKKWQCFKNLPYSVISYHQVYMCYMQLTCCGSLSSYLEQNEIIAKGDTIDFGKVYPHLVANLSLSTGQDCSSYCFVYRSESAVILGHHWKQGSAFRITDSEPTFARFICAIVKNDIKYFIGQCLLVEYFDEHISAYIVKEEDEFVIIPFQSLSCKWPLSVHMLGEKICIKNLYSPVGEIY